MGRGDAVAEDVGEDGCDGEQHGPAGGQRESERRNGASTTEAGAATATTQPD